MKTWRNIIPALLVLTTLTACSPDAGNPSRDKGSPKSISLDQTRQVGMHVLLNRYPDAKIISEREGGQSCTYRFSTNGVTAPFILIVDRKTSKARFEKASD